jgi:hypothetical protein
VCGCVCVCMCVCVCVCVDFVMTEVFLNMCVDFVMTEVFLTHWHTQPAVRQAEPSMPLLLILALCQ